MTQAFPLEAAFDSLAEVYDTEPNPLLALEQRTLGPLIPDVRGLDVLDAGCGTGRWLHQLTGRSARSLVGVDVSAEMLAVAANKLAGNCELRLGSCMALPVAAASADLVLSSFVLSYLEDLDAFVREMDQVARPGASLIIADMHPQTEKTLGWKRSFRANCSHTHIRDHARPLRQIIDAFNAQGFKLLALEEPAFGAEERSIFEQNGKLDAYQAAANLPAIYLLQLRKPPSSARRHAPSTESIVLSGARCALGPTTAASAAVTINGEYIESIRDDAHVPFLGNSLNLSGFLLLPGLINGHDHLEFSLHPNIGNGPYRNAEHWAQDIHANWAPLIAEHGKVQRSTCLWWGAIRNLLCGATTVCHHNPIYPELTGPDFPIRVVTEFGWSHSISFEPQLAAKLAARCAGQPFILHAGEGVDEQSAREIFDLDRMHALDQHTVVVHGLALNPESASLMNQRRSGLILCPTSNQFLFHRPHSGALIRSLNRVILGSDSPLTAIGDLLDEIGFAHSQMGLDANSIYEMVTTLSAEVLGRSGGEGTLAPGSVADIVVVRDFGLSPAITLAQLSSKQIELVIVRGRVQLAGPTLIGRLPRHLKQGLQQFDVDGHPRWVRAPIDSLFSEVEEVFEGNLRLGGKRVRRATSA